MIRHHRIDFEEEIDDDNSPCLDRDNLSCCKIEQHLHALHQIFVFSSPKHVSKEVQLQCIDLYTKDDNIIVTKQQPQQQNRKEVDI
jgi:hypothetical protein